MTTDGTDPRLERWATDDPHDARRALGATGLLRAFNDAGVLTAADVHVARRTADVVGETDESVRLAVALAVRAVRQGSVCVDLTAFGAAGEAGRPGAPAASGAPGPEAPDDPPLPWPDPDGWLERVAASPLAERSVVRADLGLLYLDRYWREECQVRDHLVARLAGLPPAVDDTLLERGAARLFPGDAWAEQRAAALATARRRTTVLTGGPGRGKTTTVAGLLALLAEQHAEQHAGARGPAGGQPLRIALAAPTGKAAARLQDAVVRALEPPPSGPGAAGTVARPGFTDDDRHRLAGLRASTLHRLLGAVPGSSTRFRHDRSNRLPHDVVVVDETSMVSLTLMARLLEAVRPEARLVLVGDPDQLASVEAGAVLADLVAGLGARDDGAVAALHTDHRSESTAITGLAAAVQAGDDGAVLAALTAGDTAVELVHPDDADAVTALQDELARHALEVRRLALAGDADGALELAGRHRLLCAHREGPWGAASWNRQVERRLGEAAGTVLGAAAGTPWYAGRPVLVTANDYALGLFNGDTGVVVAEGDTLRAHIEGGASYAVARLGDVETLHAMTVHKSQGGQAETVTVLLPDETSPLLTRELFYTAVTRARRRVRVVGTPEAVAAAVRRRARRASGLARRLTS
ncbi:exodeoxyribonuclease V subunit alpha [Promicromonospora citrea]|uniref:RecBCD enzyme subunit RecD n=2 Tax=Promicromonospora citrea TaxID=43677 RepID=A0A8H9GPM4_9MICO|nr:exodeoxyribonuclease V subunit alpha [Promicromonospora citrea]GGM43475.1 RecBCD enzyme subunit RecD [Promicromonospora citrea]